MSAMSVQEFRQKVRLVIFETTYKKNGKNKTGWTGVIKLNGEVLYGLSTHYNRDQVETEAAIWLSKQGNWPCDYRL